MTEADANTASAPALTPAAEGVSFSQLVWKQFRRSRESMAGLILSALMLAIALLAPFLAHRLPLVWWDDAGVVSYPLLREFFAPAGSTELVLETAFNYALLLLPAWFLLGLLLPRGPIRTSGRVAAAMALLLPFILVQSRNDQTPYRELAAKGSGHGCFALLPYGPLEQGFGPKVAPTWYGNNAEKSAYHAPGYHVFGTDEIGRDVLARMIHGARISLSVGFVSVTIATLIGILIGACAGYFGGWIDVILSRAIEIMMCFPTFFLILAIIAIFDKRSILNIMIIIGITGWTGIARLTRAEFLRQRQLDYVTSARALGASHARIIVRHILPNAVAPVLVSITFGIASAILTESGLSFLGFGVAPPTATWGELLNQSRQGPLQNWWLVFFPGFFIFLGVFAYNLVGEGLRDAMDPRMRGNE